MELPPVVERILIRGDIQSYQDVETSLSVNLYQIPLAQFGRDDANAA